MNKSKVVSISVTSLLILLSTLMMMSYIHISATSKSIPFYMSHNYVKLRCDNNIVTSTEVIQKYNESKDVTIISTYNNEGYMGIYDPNMMYALFNTMISLGDTRYFSSDDYINGTKSGIIVSDKLVYNIASYKASKSPYIDDVMYCTDSQNILALGGKINAIINIFSLENLGDTIYIDYHSEGGQDVVNQIRKDLIVKGYTVDNEKPSVFDAMIDSNKGFFSVVMMGWIIFYFLYSIVSYWYFFNQRRELLIHYLHGGRFRTIAKVKIGPLLLASLVSLFIAFLFSEYQRYVKYLQMDMKSLLLLFVIHMLLIFIIHITTYGIVFRTIKVMGGIQAYER